MTIPTLSTPPTTPQRLTDTPDQFVLNMDAWLTYEGGLSDELNAWATAVGATVSGTDFNSNSTTSLAIGTGSKSLTVNTGKLYQIGQYVIIAETATPANFMAGQVTAYNSGTGALTVNVTVTGGSGTIAAWSIGLVPVAAMYAALAGATFTGLVTTATPASGQEALVIPHGAAPSAPTNGSVWTTTAGAAIRINGTSYDVVLRTATQTLTGKTIDLASNTLAGTLAQFNAACSDADFASLAGAETLTNKTITRLALIGAITHDHYVITDGAGFAISPANGDKQAVTLGANRTPTVSGWSAGDSVTLFIDDGAGYSIDWSTINPSHIGGSAPTLETSGFTELELYYNGTTYYLSQRTPQDQTPAGINYVGGTTATGTTSAGTTAPNVSLTGLTGGLGSAPIVDDFVVVSVAVAASSDLNITMTSGGWTEDQDIYSNNAGSTDTNLAVYYKKMGSTPDTSFDLSIPAASNGSYAVAVQVFRGVHTSIPLDTTSTTATITNSVLVNPASITPVTGLPTAVLIGAGAHNGGVDTFGASYLTNFISAGADGSTYDATIGMGYTKNILAAYDGAAWTHTQTDNTGFSCATVSMLLRAA